MLQVAPQVQYFADEYFEVWYIDWLLYVEGKCVFYKYFYIL